MPGLHDLSMVMNPIDSAQGLPNEHYVSDDMFAAEREALLFANWAGIGFAKDLEPGEAMPVDLAGLPLVALRTHEGEVKVFQNTCRHRGMILVERKKKLGGVLRCPYHSWCYALTGELVATPHVGGPGMNRHDGIRRDQLGLVEMRSHVWRDVIFVNVNGRAPGFTEYAGEAIARWSEFERQTLLAGGDESSFNFDIACNWKLVVENFCESYHLPWVHPGLNSYSRLEDHYNIEVPGRFSGQGTLVYRPMIETDGSAFPDFPGLSGKWDTGAEYLAIYPNVLMGTHRDHAFAVILEPNGKDRTRELVALYYSTEEAAKGDGLEPLRRKNAETWYGVFEEDLFVVEGMQKGRKGIRFDGGRFSPVMDGPTHCFHHWVASHMGCAVQAAE